MSTRKTQEYVLTFLTGFHPFEHGSHDWLSAGSVAPFAPVAKYLPQATKRWWKVLQLGSETQTSGLMPTARTVSRLLRLYGLRKPAGQAKPDVSSNFFLFFDSDQMNH